MKKRLKIILISVFLILAMALVIIFIVSSQKIETPVTVPEKVEEPNIEEEEKIERYTGQIEDKTININIVEEKDVVLEKEPAEEIKLELTAEDLKKISFSFAERFGSYSNQSNYGNIEDLKTLMNTDMRIWIDSWLKTLRAVDYSGSYYGVSTKALTGEVMTFSRINGEASILVTTKRRESRETLGNYTEFMQDILINFVKESGEWKTSGAFWQEK